MMPVNFLLRSFFCNLCLIDTLTHLVVGGCIGELAAGRTLGRKALLLGGAAQLLPDVDVVAALWLPPHVNLLVHRGPTHSLLAAVLLTVLPLLLLRGPSAPGRNGAALLIGPNLFAHLLLDSFNAYGTELLWPFYEGRISFNMLYVVDPLFTLAPLVVFLWLLWKRRLSRRLQVRAARRALTYCGLYLLLAAGAKRWAELRLEDRMGSRPDTFITTPAPYTILLWYAVVQKEDSGFYTSYYSVLDSGDELKLDWAPRGEERLGGRSDSTVTASLKRFSQGFYTVSGSGDALRFNDLRFGRVGGWLHPAAPFTFGYFLDRPDAYNRTVMQRGRVAGWNRHTWTALWKRMWGRHQN